MMSSPARLLSTFCNWMLDRRYNAAKVSHFPGCLATEFPSTDVPACQKIDNSDLQSSTCHMCNGSSHSYAKIQVI
ncbi:hypothetical protein VTN96DRAFT_2290 [Rasamsonia emersonii]